MQRVVNVNKLRGTTPLEMIERLRKKMPQYQDEKMTYAGRLDPMAEGVLMILIGSAVHEKEKYQSLDKVYEAEIVLGFETDTHDMLGMATRQGDPSGATKKIVAEIEAMKGIHEYQFPIYASKPVQGRPLFEWAREGRISEIEIPTRLMQVHQAIPLEQGMIRGKDLREDIVVAIAKVHGDFRQDAIIEQWKKVLENKDMHEYPTVRIRIQCASGTYIRTIVHEMGKRIGCGAIVTRLIRTRVGDHTIDHAIVL